MKSVLCYFTEAKQRSELRYLPLTRYDHDRPSELQKRHGYAGITREEGLQNGQAVRKVSCQHTTYCILNTNIKK